MNEVRIRAAAVLAVGLIVGIVASAVVTCAPGSAPAPASQMASCFGTSQRCLTSAATGGCLQHEPSLTAAKAELLKAPTRHASPRLLAIALVTMMPTVLPSGTGSPPGLTRTLSHPTYILLSRLRI